ncbi:MAG: oligosaccharide flippase family protein [bacterium]|nr:oligosaccharide flippase family protein [bacterium]
MKKRIQDMIAHPLFSGSAIMIIGSNSINVINYLYHLIIGRMLGPIGYGELASLISIIGLLGTLPGSVALVITKQISSTKNEQEANNLVKWFKKKILLMSVIFSFIVLIFSPLLTSFLNIRNVSYLILIAVSLLFTLQSLLNRAILQGLLKFKETIISILIENSSKLILSIALVYLGFQVGGIMLALVISGALGLYITVIYLKIGSGSQNEANFSPDTKSMLSFAIPVALQSLSITSLYSSDVILVKHFFPAQEAGIYAALSTLGKIIFFGAGPITTVMFPLVSQKKARGENYKKIFIYSFFATSLLAVSVLMVYWLFPFFAINILYGASYLGAANLLIWFGLFISLFTLSSLIINYGLSLGRSSIVILPIIAALAQIILIWLFHENLFTVIMISNLVTALLLIALIIYSIYGNQINLSHRSDI